MHNVVNKTMYALNKRCWLHVETTYNSYQSCFSGLLCCVVRAAAYGIIGVTVWLFLSARQLLHGNYYGEVLSKSFLALHVKLFGFVIFTKGNLSNVYFREVQKISHYMKI